MTHSLVVIKLTQWILIFVDKNRRSYLTEIKRFHVWSGNVGRYKSSVEMLLPIDRLENAGEQRRIFNANRRQTALCNLRTGELSRPLVGVRPCPCALLCARTLSHGSSHGNGNVRACSVTPATVSRHSGPNVLRIVIPAQTGCSNDTDSLYLFLFLSIQLESTVRSSKRLSDSRNK